MKSLVESILSSTGSGRRLSIYNSLAKLFKNDYKHEYIGKNIHKVHIAGEGMCYIDNCFNFYFHGGFNDTIVKTHIKDIHEWFKSIGYKKNTSEEQPYLLFLDDNQYYYYKYQSPVFVDYEVFVCKLENSVIFIVFHKSDTNEINYYEAAVFALEIDKKTSYIEDWKSDKDFVNVLKNKLG